MKTVLCSLLASFVMVSSLAGRELSRSPVQGTQRIAGREVARFVVAQAIPFNSPAYDPSVRWSAVVAVIPAGQYVQVSEDRDGIYFQSTAGMGAVREAEGNYSVGGLYVGKQKLGEVYAFFGDARGQGRILKSHFTLPPEAQKKLLVAQASKGGKP